ncbi:MAG: META domain-containing protein [Thiofilum sp.]|uniref:META domain-containing protein n=1 Tax=Thiofilum sp. TaxID=2212733 RepID=UPI0025D6298D|nr:META domain-containing protein [Thiofilum sp.]MBK8452080.1 META domain-containing protein [Thiofilum sp.]
MITFIQRQRWRLSLTLLGCLLLILNGCNTKTNPRSINYQLLNQSQWVLSKSVNQLPRPVSISFERGRMNGFNGCNSYSGSYLASEDGTLVLGQPSVTRMLCSGAADEIERDYMAQLTKVRMYALVRGQLLLLDTQRKPLLTFQAQQSK